MTHTISELWNGSIDPCKCCGSHDPEVNHLIALIERNREELANGLTTAQMETLQKYADCYEEYMLRMLELAFCDGFSLAAKLTAEALV